MDEKSNKDLKKERDGILIRNIKEFYGNEIEAEKKREYNTSVNSLKMNQEISEVIRKDVERIIKMLNI